MGESRGGISPPRAPKTLREPLDSHGFRCYASDIHEPPNVIAPKKEGDGAALDDEDTVQVTAQVDCELLLLDLD